MLLKVLHILLLLPCSFATVTINTNQLFQNTLKRWGIQPRTDKDRLERWTRFVRAKKTVEQTTTGVILESLNMFTVLNDEEFENRVRPLFRGYNITDVLREVPSWSPHAPAQTDSRRKRSSALPATFDYWEKDVGLSAVRDQMSCGSCWSFPNVGTIEALNKQLTGDDTEFSEQYFVDCTFSKSGCAGGTVNEGYKVTMMRQYLVSAKAHPYTADYQSCKIAADIANFKNNAMDKIWVQDWIPLSKDENSVLKGLLTSPVAFGSMISDNLYAYSGGMYSDTLCATEGAAHSMLLVGYTDKILRVKASYGDVFGDKGYINYKRGHVGLNNCKFFDKAFALAVTYRRDFEYEYCNGGKVATYQDCKKSCQAMNTKNKSGWNLATIPTQYHNQKVMEKLAVDYPGKKKNDSFNYLWIGLEDEEKDGTYKWLDSSTPANYFNLSSHKDMGGKYGLINKLAGDWITKNSLTFPARGLCSRPTNCWNIEKAVKNGAVRFSKAGRSEGTKATIKCKQGKLVGSSKLTCVGGQWDQPLPTCSVGGACTYSGEAGTRATISPNRLNFENKEKITITCTNGTSTEHVCTDGAFIPKFRECPDDDDDDDDTISKTVMATLSTLVAVISGLHIFVLI